MGRKLDALLGRNFKTSKFKTLLKLAISRSNILSNQHQVRLSHARSDVKELLVIGQQDRAMLRVEHVIKEQNMVDVFYMIDFYLNLLLERVKLLAQSKECHEELGEATKSLIYAASRCGDFPEIQRIREVLTSHFGKDFAARAVELRNNCGVNPKMVHKFSTRRPSFESKSKTLAEIASECGLTLHLEEEDSPSRYDKSLHEEKVKQEEERKAADKVIDADENSLVRRVTLFKDIKDLEEFSESMKIRKKYSGVAAAAQEAFESAAHAAVAAKAALEMSIENDRDYHHHRVDDHDDRIDHEDLSSLGIKALTIHEDLDSEKEDEEEDEEEESENEIEEKESERLDVIRREEEVEDENENEVSERALVCDIRPSLDIDESKSDEKDKKRLSSASKDDHDDKNDNDDEKGILDFSFKSFK